YFKQVVLQLSTSSSESLGGCLGSEQDAQCPVPVQKRIDCHPQPDASQEACEARGCIWCGTDVPNAPWCFFPEDNPYDCGSG
uniref:P-type domain-containing protein n=1 Tax=Malurus cyaneus samueli TaxID=2593467 RepID=A0A8C5X2G5_9PASS